MLDYYQILDIPNDASPDEVRRAFRIKAAKYHPDRNPGNPLAAELFKQIEVAYQELSDEGKRQAYDDMLWHAASGSCPPQEPEPPPARPEPPPFRTPPFTPSSSPPGFQKQHPKDGNGFWNGVRFFVTIAGAVILAMSLVGLVVLVVLAFFGSRSTVRSLNYCRSCGYSWYPRGHFVSRECPHCRNPVVSDIWSNVLSPFGDAKTLGVVSEIVGWTSLSGSACLISLVAIISLTTPPDFDQSISRLESSNDRSIEESSFVEVPTFDPVDEMSIRQRKTRRPE